MKILTEKDLKELIAEHYGCYRNEVNIKVLSDGETEKVYVIVDYDPSKH